MDYGYFENYYNKANNGITDGLKNLRGSKLQYIYHISPEVNGYEVVEAVEKAQTNALRLLVEVEGINAESAIRMADKFHIEYSQSDKDYVVYLMEVETYMIKNNTNFVEDDNVPQSLLSAGELETDGEFVWFTKSRKLQELVKSRLADFHQTLGPAGSGKSYKAMTAIKAASDAGLSILVVAPTHKAKKALQAKLDDAGVEETVTTIHSALNVGKDWREEVPYFDIVFIDEVGCVGDELAYNLLSSLNFGRVEAFGDPNQLPPVNAYGSLALLLTKLGVETETLTGNHRSESKAIVEMGLGVLQNDLEKMYEARQAPEIMLLNWKENYDARTKNQLKDNAHDIVITHTNATRVKVNIFEQELRIERGEIQPKAGYLDYQEHYKAQGKTVTVNLRFYENDEVLCNNNITSLQGEKMNTGDIFTVVEIGIETVTLADEDGFDVLVKHKDMQFNFTLAYALTIHKSQGSEWNNVLYVAGENDTNNLAYVAVTRAKRNLILACSEAARITNIAKNKTKPYEIKLFI
jgi:ATP-dependent exoDNAse (exonuclease V) alpha subunit